MTPVTRDTVGNALALTLVVGNLSLLTLLTGPLVAPLLVPEMPVLILVACAATAFSALTFGLFCVVVS